MSYRPLAISLIVFSVVVTGCAMRPEIARVAAPAPTGVAAARPPAPAPPAVTAPEPGVTPPATAAPTPPPPPPAAFRPVKALQDIYFDFDRYDIRTDAARTLDANIDWIQSNPSALILIEGHCDERGTNEYNMALGERRARAAMNYLVAHGVAPKRITTISYGEERPVCIERTEACWARNRRAHFLAKME